MEDKDSLICYECRKKHGYLSIVILEFFIIIIGGYILLSAIGDLQNIINTYNYRIINNNF